MSHFCASEVVFKHEWFALHRMLPYFLSRLNALKEALNPNLSPSVPATASHRCGVGTAVLTPRPAELAPRPGPLIASTRASIESVSSSEWSISMVPLPSSALP